jgi:hypothetical protein
MNCDYIADWLMSPDISPCTMDPIEMDRFITALASYHIKLSKEDLFRKINAVQQLCENIYNKYSKIGGEPYTLSKTFQLLKGKRLWSDALRLEACRALISSYVGAGGDIMRMGANAVREGQAAAVIDAQRKGQDALANNIKIENDHKTAKRFQRKKKKKKEAVGRHLKAGNDHSGGDKVNKRKLLPHISVRFFLSDFPSDQRDVFKASTTRMFAFLMSTPESGSIPFWRQKLTQPEAVRAALRAGLLTPPPSVASDRSEPPTRRQLKSRALVVLSSAHENMISKSQHGNEVKRVFSSFRGAEKASAGTYSYYQDSVTRVVSDKDGALYMNKKDVRSRHVTRDRITGDRRIEYVQLLANDPCLGPILNLVRNILNFPLPYLSNDAEIGLSLFNYTSF